MKRSIKLAVAAAVALSATSAFATNGDNLIGVGAKSRGMGGVGIGMSHGAESALSNPALITSVKGTEVSFGGTIFMPDVESNSGLGAGGMTKSKADLSVIPEVAIAQNVGNGFAWGVGMFGTAGMGVDYRNDPTTSNLHFVSNLQLMQFAVPLAYKSNGFSVGIAPVLQYGSLDMNYQMPGGAFGTAMSNTNGVAQDFGFGYNIGAAFETSGLTLGAVYKSAIDMEYKDQLSIAGAQFNLPAMGLTLTDNLEQPAEMGVGASYTVGGHTFAVDYKKVKWSDAKGYKDFGWDDQNIYMIGYQFAQDNWALRAGYNYGKSPIKEQDPTQYVESALNLLNLLGFPATVEKHYTIGGSYAFSKMTSLDLAYVYVPEVSDTFSTAGMTGSATSITTKHSQDAMSFQLNFAF